MHAYFIYFIYWQDCAIMTLVPANKCVVSSRLAICGDSVMSGTKRNLNFVVKRGTIKA